MVSVDVKQHSTNLLFCCCLWTRMLYYYAAMSIVLSFSLHYAGSCCFSVWMLIVTVSIVLSFSLHYAGFCCFSVWMLQWALCCLFLSTVQAPAVSQCGCYSKHCVFCHWCRQRRWTTKTATQEHRPTPGEAESTRQSESPQAADRGEVLKSEPHKSDFRFGFGWKHSMNKRSGQIQSALVLCKTAMK